MQYYKRKKNISSSPTVKLISFKINSNNNNNNKCQNYKSTDLSATGRFTNRQYWQNLAPIVVPDLLITLSFMFSDPDIFIKVFTLTWIQFLIKSKIFL